jgi:hypothetical protein
MTKLSSFRGTTIGIARIGLLFLIIVILISSASALVYVRLTASPPSAIGVTTTSLLNANATNNLECSVNRVSVFTQIVISNMTTTTETFGTSTTITYANSTIYATATNITESIGYATTVTVINSTSTFTGALAVWNVVVCTFASNNSLTTS